MGIGKVDKMKPIFRGERFGLFLKDTISYTFGKVLIHGEYGY